MFIIIIKCVPATLCGIEFACLLRKFLLKVLGSLSPNSFVISCFRTVCTASGMSLLSDTENSQSLAFLYVFSFLSHVKQAYGPLCTSFEESHQTLVEPGVIGVQWVSSLHRLQHQKILLYKHKHTLWVSNHTSWIIMLKFISMLTFPEVDLKGQQVRLYFILY